jgi:hypothetical protein
MLCSSMFSSRIGLLDHNALCQLDPTSACTIAAIWALLFGGNSSLATYQVRDLILKFILYCFQKIFQVPIEVDKQTMSTVELKVRIPGTYVFSFSIP